MMVIFNLGECRHVRLEICSDSDDDFVVERATYEFKKANGVIEAFGSSNIFEHVIDTVIEPNEKGTYFLVVTYAIADEKLVDTVEVVVT